MRYPIVLTFLVLTSTWLCAQELQLERIEKIHKALTREYDESRFVPGYYVTETDTIRTSVYVYRRRQRELGHYAVVMSDSNGLKILCPEDVKQYSIQGRVYESVLLAEKHYFMQTLERGSVNLYMIAGIAESGMDLFLVEKAGSNELIMLDPEANNIQEVRLIVPSSPQTGAGSNLTAIISKGNAERFRRFAASYFRDCKAVVSKVTLDFYGIGDISLIVNEYNRCVPH